LFEEDVGIVIRKNNVMNITAGYALRLAVRSSFNKWSGVLRMLCVLMPRSCGVTTSGKVESRTIETLTEIELTPSNVRLSFGC